MAGGTDLRDRTAIQALRAAARQLRLNPDLTEYELLIFRALEGILDRLDALIARRAADGHPIP